MNNLVEITVKGQGKVSAMPDSIAITLIVATIKPDYPEALSKLNEHVAAIHAALSRAGTTERAVTQSYDIAEQWTNQHDAERRKFHGFKASQNMSFTIPLDNGLLGRVVTELAASKTEPGMRIEFIIRDTAPLQQAARKNAVEKAKASAQDLAAVAGLVLGAVKSITYIEGVVSTYQNLSMNLDKNVMLDFDMTPDVNPGAVHGEEAVNMVWNAVASI